MQTIIRSAEPANRRSPDAVPANLSLTVAALAERDGRFLMVEEWVHDCQVINQPAGHVESGESLLDAVIREAREETRWDFAPETVSGIYLWQSPRNGRHFLRVAFAGRCTHHHEHRRLDQGIVRTLWLSREELVRRQPELRSPMVLRSVDDYLANSRQPCGSLMHLSVENLCGLASRL